MRLLLTRPEPQAEDTARRLAAAGHEVVHAPMLALVAEPFAPVDLDGVVALAATSRSAVDAMAGRPDLDALRRLPLYAVGDATAAAARRLGFARVVSAAGAAADLAAALAAALPPGAGILHLAGRDRAGDLATPLAARGLPLAVVTLYRAEPAAVLPAAAAAALAAADLDAGLVYSARTAAALVAAADRGGLAEALAGLPLLALSSAVAAPLTAAGVRRVLVAATPDEDALLALLDRLATP